MRLRGGRLGFGRFDLLAGPHLLQCLQMRARRVVLALRLHHRNLCVIYQLLGQRSLLLQIGAAFIYLLRRLESLLRRLNVGFGFGAIFRNSGARGRLQRRLGLLVLAPALRLRRGEVAVLELDRKSVV